MDARQVSPQDRVWQLALGFANTSVLHILIKTGVIEQMREKPRTTREMALECGLNTDMLYRVLRFASAIDVVEQVGDRYSLTETGRFLLKDVPGSIHVGAQLFGSDAWLRAWQQLEYSLVTGDAAFDRATGQPFFEFLDTHPEYGMPFHQWMTISTTLVARAIAGAYDFAPFRSVCDIGGGQGILLKSVLAANPHLRGVLFDQESAVKDHVLADLDGRVDIQTGNFFERVPAADVLMMKSILHDWSDERCQVILGRCREIMKPTSRLLIIERVIESPADFMGAFFDLHMQVIGAGRERTEDEFSLLLHRAGMKLIRVIPTSSPMKIVEASL